MVRRKFEQSRIYHSDVIEAMRPSLKKFGIPRDIAKKVISIYMQTIRYAMGTLRPVTVPGIGTIYAVVRKRTMKSPLKEIKPKPGAYNLMCSVLLSMEGKMWLRNAIANYNYVYEDGTVEPKKKSEGNKSEGEAKPKGNTKYKRNTKARDVEPEDIESGDIDDQDI